MRRRPRRTARRRAEIGEGERRLLQSIADFGGTLVREVMTPRPDIVAVPESATIGELRKSLSRSGSTSRFPVFKDSLDNIAGFVFIKDLVALGPSDDSRPITPLVRPGGGRAGDEARARAAEAVSAAADAVRHRRR